MEACKATGGVRRIPIDETHVRSLNLSVSAGIGVYEALRQLARFADGVVDEFNRMNDSTFDVILHDDDDDTRNAMNLRRALERVGDEGVTIANLEPVDKLEPAIRLDASITAARHHLEERHAQRPRDDVVDSQRAKTQRHDVGEVKSETRPRWRARASVGRIFSESTG